MKKWAAVMVAAIPAMAFGAEETIFGVYSGMPKEELAESVVLGEATEVGEAIQHRSKQAPNNSYMADEYFYIFGDSGLCRMVAKLSDVRSMRNRLAQDLMAKYGKPVDYEGEDQTVPDDSTHYPLSQYVLADGVQDIILAPGYAEDSVSVVYLFESYPDCQKSK